MNRSCIIIFIIADVATCH